MKKVKNDSIIEVDYEGYLDDGTLFDTSKEDLAKQHNIYNQQRQYAPLKVQIGQGQLIKGFENALIGMKENEEKEVTIQPEDAYGNHNPQFVKEVEKTIFGEKVPKKGDLLLMKIENQPAPALVMDVKDKITLDFNHPLAGKVLTFKIKVVKVE